MPEKNFKEWRHGQTNIPLWHRRRGDYGRQRASRRNQARREEVRGPYRRINDKF